MVNDSFIRTFSAPCFLRSLRSTWFMALALFVAGMILFTAHNNFRFYYHPDEKGKVRQIADHTRNCNHPLMMLTLTNVATQFHRGSLTSQEIVQTGRAVSAFFASLTAVAMALLARRMAGAFGHSRAGATRAAEQVAA